MIDRHERELHPRQINVHVAASLVSLG